MSYGYKTMTQASDNVMTSSNTQHERANFEQQAYDTVRNWFAFLRNPESMGTTGASFTVQDPHHPKTDDDKRYKALAETLGDAVCTPTMAPMDFQGEETVYKDQDGRIVRQAIFYGTESTTRPNDLPEGAFYVNYIVQRWSAKEAQGIAVRAAALAVSESIKPSR